MKESTIEGTPIKRDYPNYASRNVPGIRGRSAPGTGIPAAEQIQIGDIIQRLPDFAYQPEGGSLISEVIPATVCPSGFTASSEWTNVITYTVEENRKLVIVDAWVAFTNPYVAAITSARLIDEFGFPLNMSVRIQKICCSNPGNRLAIPGKRIVYLQIKKDANTDAWDFGEFYGKMTGWDVPDMFSNNERIFK